MLLKGILFVFFFRKICMKFHLVGRVYHFSPVVTLYSEHLMQRLYTGF